MPPASYLDFLDLIQHAVMVITDSGGVQEETTFLGVPCLTYRDNTERPVTVSMGTNRVVGCDPQHLLLSALEVLENAPHQPGQICPFAPPAVGWADGLEDRAYSQRGLAERSCLCRGACASVTQSESSGLVEAIQALRTWIESRQFAGYEPFDLLNSPYLSGHLAWARKALPGILLIQAGKRFAGLRFAAVAEGSSQPKSQSFGSLSFGILRPGTIRLRCLGPGSLAQERADSAPFAA